MRPRIVILSVLMLSACAGTVARRSHERASDVVGGQIHKIEELTAPEIAAFDKSKTLVVLPIGTLEAHGPHLPIGTDTYSAVYRAEQASRVAAASLVGWNVVLMPPIHFGEGGAHEIGGVHVHPGTYGIRHTTLRALTADVGGQLARNGFKHIFVIHAHGGRNHNIAITEACDFIQDTFKVTMLNLTSLMWADPEAQAAADALAVKHYPKAALTAAGVDLHAGWGETSDLLFMRSDLVRQVYRELPALPGRNMAELRVLASADSWPGYFSAPAAANGDYGRANTELRVNTLARYIVRAAGGEDFAGKPRHPEQLKPDAATAAANQRSLDHERQFESQLEAWLSRRGERH